MKGCQVLFVSASVVLAVLLSACLNPVDFTPSVSIPATIQDEANSLPANGLSDTGSFTVTIPVGPESGGGAAGRAAAGLGTDAIRYGGVMNTLLLVVLDTETGEVAASYEANRSDDSDSSADVSVGIPPATTLSSS